MLRPNDIKHSPSEADSSAIIKKVMNFLQLFMCVTLAKRIVSLVLISLDIPNKRITELTGCCDKSIYTLKKALRVGEIDSLFHVGGGGRKRKLVDVEQAIIDEVNTNDYHSQQQIAGMIKEKFGLVVSLPVVSRLLKKTTSKG
jgi:transposase